MISDETKICPFCAETIKQGAVICRFCKMNLQTGESVQEKPKPILQSEEVKARSGVADGVKLGVGMFIVLPILIFLGIIFLGFVFLALL